jgi:hypothetical protein
MLKRFLLTTLLIITWLAVFTSSDASLLGPERLSAENSFAMFMPEECLGTCEDEHADRVATCEALPTRRAKRVCLRQAARANQVCTLTCVEQ